MCSTSCASSARSNSVSRNPGSSAVAVGPPLSAAQRHRVRGGTPRLPSGAARFQHDPPFRASRRRCRLALRRAGSGCRVGGRVVGGPSRCKRVGDCDRPGHGPAGGPGATPQRDCDRSRLDHDDVPRVALRPRALALGAHAPRRRRPRRGARRDRPAARGLGVARGGRRCARATGRVRGRATRALPPGDGAARPGLDMGPPPGRPAHRPRARRRGGRRP